MSQAYGASAYQCQYKATGVQPKREVMADLNESVTSLMQKDINLAEAKEDLKKGIKSAVSEVKAMKRMTGAVASKFTKALTGSKGPKYQVVSGAVEAESEPQVRRVVSVSSSEGAVVIGATRETAGLLDEQHVGDSAPSTDAAKDSEGLYSDDGSDSDERPPSTEEGRDGDRSRPSPDTFEWDAKRFGTTMRPLECDSIFDIPTSRFPIPSPRVKPSHQPERREDTRILMPAMPAMLAMPVVVAPKADMSGDYIRNTPWPVVSEMEANQTSARRRLGAIFCFPVAAIVLLMILK